MKAALIALFVLIAVPTLRTGTNLPQPRCRTSDAKCIEIFCKNSGVCLIPSPSQDQK